MRNKATISTPFRQYRSAWQAVIACPRLQMELETIKKYINIMRKYPEIYAVGDSDYSNMYKKEIAWKKIKQKMGIDGEN